MSGERPTPWTGARRPAPPPATSTIRSAECVGLDAPEPCYEAPELTDARALTPRALVYAIGATLSFSLTGNPVAEVHAALRGALAKRFGAAGSAMRLLYGGSVKPSNSKELMSVANVNGALVGGASLKADDFLGIIAAYR